MIISTLDRKLKKSMYLAMSRLKVIFGKEADFETAWKKRETKTDGVKGFKKFNLIKASIDKEFSLYIFHSEWNSEEDFTNWTKSDLFKLAHKNPTTQKNLYLGAPEFEGFKIII